MRQKSVPEDYRDYPCEDYFAGGWSVRGHFDEPSQLWVVTPLAESYLDRTIEFFAIGHSGCGGINSGYRKGQPGLWAFYPIEREFKFMAATVAELAEGYSAGRLSV